MVARFVKSLVKGEDFIIASETDLAQYITQDTVYTTSDESIVTVGSKTYEPEEEGQDPTVVNGVITAVSAGRAIVTAMNSVGGVEISVNAIGIDIDYQKSGAEPIIEDEEIIGYNIDFEDETEVKFSAVTPNHIIRAKVVNALEQPVAGLEVVQPSDTSVIVKATSSSTVSGILKMELINRHSEYVGLTEDLPASEQYTNIYGELITKTYSTPSEEVYRGVKIWDSTNKCYRYVQSNIDPETGLHFNQLEKTPLDPQKFYESVYETSINVSGIKLPSTVNITVSNYYNITDLSSAGNTGEITITAGQNVTTDSVRLESWPMDLGFRPNVSKNKFLFDLNSAVPYKYKLKSFYKGVIKDYTVNVLGDRLMISNKPVITNEATRTKAYIVNIGEVSAIEFYSNPVRDKNYITYTVDDDDAVELFNVGTVKLARFNKVGTYTIAANCSNGKNSNPEIATISVTVVDPAQTNVEANVFGQPKYTIHANVTKVNNENVYTVTDSKEYIASIYDALSNDLSTNIELEQSYSDSVMSGISNSIVTVKGNVTVNNQTLLICYCSTDTNTLGLQIGHDSITIAEVPDGNE